MHNFTLFRCVDTNNRCSLSLLSTAATVCISSGQSVSGLFISEPSTFMAVDTSMMTNVLPRKYTWPMGGYFPPYTRDKCWFSKSATARAGACATASSWEWSSASRFPYALSSRASNFVNIAMTGTVKNKLQTKTKTKRYLAYHSLCHILRKS